MKKMILRTTVSVFVCTCLVLMLFSCVSAEERAARQAEQAKAVKTALDTRNYKVSINRMYPMKGGSKTVSYGYCIEVRNDSLISYLPYIGRAYNVPYGGGKGFNFSAPISNYREQQQKSDKRHIEIDVTNEEDIYHYTLSVFDNGNCSLDVESRQRERISYSGEMDFTSRNNH